MDLFVLLCTHTEPWLQKKVKKKTKKRKLSPSVQNSKKKRKNFSIKPPNTSSSKGNKTKTGFNSKSLQFEPGTCTYNLSTSPYDKYCNFIFLAMQLCVCRVLSVRNL